MIDIRKTKAVILAGGRGTRLLPLTKYMPKPLLPVDGVSVIERCIQKAADAGIREAVITIGYMGDMIRNRLGDSYSGVELTYFTEKTPLGTAGGCASCESFFGDAENIAVLSGDCVFDVDIRDVIEYHEKRECAVTIVTVRVDNPLEYGIVVTADDGKIRNFIEKPWWSQAFCDRVNTGMYIFRRHVMKMIPRGREYDFGRDLFPAMQKQNIPMYAYLTDKYWCDIGDPSSYIECNLHLSGGNSVMESRNIGNGCVIDKSVIFSGAEIGDGCTITDSVVFTGAVINNGDRISGKIVMPDVISDIHRSSPDLYELGFRIGSLVRRAGVAGVERREVIRGIADAGSVGYDLGADERYLSFGANYLGLDCAVSSSDRTQLYDSTGLPAKRSLMRKINNVSLPDTDKGKGKIIVVPEMRSLYYESVNASVITEYHPSLIRKKYDIWKLIAIICLFNKPRRVALPYSMPASLGEYLETAGVSVMKYALCPSDDSSDAARSVAADNPWMIWYDYAGAMVEEIAFRYKKSIAELASCTPDFTRLTDIVAHEGKRSPAYVMGEFGEPDGEGCCKVYKKGRVRLIPDGVSYTLLADADSAEFGEEIMSRSKEELIKIFSGD